MSNKLALKEILTLGEVLAKSGYFSDAKQASQAIVKIQAGQELGIGPVASMSQLHIVHGKIVVGGGVMAGLVDNAPNRRYKAVEHTELVCVIEFFENEISVGVSEFSMDDAKKGGLDKKDVWKMWPRNMLFNRAISNGVKWFFPGLLNGQAVYTEGEIEDDEPEMIIENPTQITSDRNEDRQKWIEDIMALEDFPTGASPPKKIAFVNEQFEEKGLDFAPFTMPELLALNK